MSSQQQSTTGNEIDPDGVNHPSHYNNHPSGVECIEIKRHLSANLGDAFKYVFRRDEKDEPVKNLNKAVWYLRDEIIHLDQVPASRLNWSLLKALDKIIETDPLPQAQAFYVTLRDCIVPENAGRREPLIDCLISAQRLICLYCRHEPLQDL